MKLADVERAVRLQIGLPEPRTRKGEQPVNPTQDLEHLYLLLMDLRKESELVGKIPAGYPKYVDVVMRFIHALLPWYTRPIEKFSGLSARTVSELTEHVAHLVRDQQTCLRRIQELETEVQALRARLEPR